MKLRKILQLRIGKSEIEEREMQCMKPKCFTRVILQLDYTDVGRESGK